MKQLGWCLGIVLLCVVTGTPQSRKTVTPGVQTAIVQQMVRDREIEDSCVRGEGSSKIVSISTIELNGDLNSEYLVTGSGCACFGARRCNQWIYRRTASGYEKIFDGFPADGIYPKKRRTNGYADLEVVYPAGQSVDSAFYIFDGSRYREATQPYSDIALGPTVVKSQELQGFQVLILYTSNRQKAATTAAERLRSHGATVSLREVENDSSIREHVRKLYYYFPNEKKQVMLIANMIRDLEPVIPTFGANDPTAIARERELALWLASPAAKRRGK